MAKFNLPPFDRDDLFFSEPEHKARNIIYLHLRYCLKLFRKLRPNCSTGPDQLGSRILKFIGPLIASPFLSLVRRMVHEGFWPQQWKVHRLIPIFKRNEYWDAGNYRGVHVTCILSKIAERLIAFGLTRYLERHGYGEMQWAYSKGKSSKDLLCYITNTWIKQISGGKKIGAYFSDISGAFDRVYTPFLLAKLRQLGLEDHVCEFFAAYLAPRTAHVVVSGCRSEDFVIENSVYQGTVLGCVLWNVFFADVIGAARLHGGSEIMFADDLNIFKIFDRHAADDDIGATLARTRQRVHKWGSLHRVAFDPQKESIAIIHPLLHSQAEFKLLGILFDPALTMRSDIEGLVARCRPKIRALLRTRSYYGISELLNQFKTHIWSLIEYHTPVIYHASFSNCDRLDRLQRSFLHDLGIDEATAFLQFNFAPLSLRRDIGMLGFLHKRVLGRAHPCFNALFPLASNYIRGHSKQLATHAGNFQQLLLKRSLFALAAVYNRLPQDVVDLDDISLFQGALTDFAKYGCSNGRPYWQYTFDPDPDTSNFTF